MGREHDKSADAGASKLIIPSPRQCTSQYFRYTASKPDDLDVHVGRNVVLQYIAEVFSSSSEGLKKSASPTSPSQCCGNTTSI